MQQSDTTGKQIGAERQRGKIRNVEILRFFLAWAIVGFHLVNDKMYDQFGFSFLKPYWIMSGGTTTGCFFILAFYFLIRGRSIQLPMITFVCRKWLRLTPLVIVVSVFGYILHRCGYWGWDWAANIEQWLLIHDWVAVSPWGQFVYTAWWCSAYMFVSVVYLALVRALPGRYMPLVLGILAVIGWRLNVCGGPDHSKFRDVLAFGNTAAGFFFLGIGALIAYIVRCTEERPTFNPSSRLVTLVYTLAEVVMVVVLLVRLFAARVVVWFNPLLVALWFSVLFVLFILKRGYFSRLLENNLSSFLGRYAYGIFVVHPLVLTCGRVVLPHFRAESIAHPWVVLGCIAGVTMLLAMAGHHFVERPIMRLCDVSRKNKGGDDTPFRV